MSDDLIEKQAEALGPWYHKIQLTPTYTTRSYMDRSCEVIWEMVRQKMTDLDYQDKAVLDLGTMDGYWAFRAEQRGAKLVVAGDIWQGSGSNVNAIWPWNRPGNGIERLMFARDVLKSKVLPVVNAEVQDLYRRMGPVIRCHALAGFEIIQCLGLLYHIPNPILGLQQIRRCLVDNGVMLLETACWTGGGDEPAMRFNRAPPFYNDFSSYWMPNEACLREMLALTGFKMDKDVRRVSQSPVPVNRVCVECRGAEVPRIRGEDFNTMFLTA